MKSERPGGVTMMRSLTLVLLLAAGSLDTVTAQTRPLALTDYYRVETVNGTAISPDGRTVVRPHVHRREREPAAQRDLGRAGRWQRDAAAPHEPCLQLLSSALEPGREAPGLHVAKAGDHGRRAPGGVRLVPADGRGRRRGVPDSRRRGDTGLQPRQQVDRVHEGREAHSWQRRPHAHRGGTADRGAVQGAHTTG